MSMYYKGSVKQNHSFENWSSQTSTLFQKSKGDLTHGNAQAITMKSTTKPNIAYSGLSFKNKQKYF